MRPKLPSSCTGRNKIGHRGPKPSAKSSHREIPGCAVGEGRSPDQGLKRRKHRSNKRRSSCFAEKLRIKEEVSRALRSMTGLEKKEEDQVEQQVAQLSQNISNNFNKE
jgi:hypothetical protein